MSSYYEFLKVQPTASIAEIQVAIEALYNQSRRLVTHHDPYIAQNANQSLLMIEQARSTLLDPVKRADYDTMLSLNNMGGLADASAQPAQMPFMTPPAPARTAPPVMGPAQSYPVVDVWTCPKCTSINPVGTKFCKKCGNQLGRNCPKCDTLLEATAQFCSNCGVDIKEFEQQREIQLAEAEQQRIMQERRVAEENARLGLIKKTATTASSMMKIGWILTVLGLCSYGVTSLIGAVLFIVSVMNALKALQMPQQIGDQVFRSQAKSALWLSIIPLGLDALGLVIALISLFASAISN